MKEGRQLHPFFSCSKVGKKNQESTEVEGSSSFTGSKEKYVTCAPIHVFESTQVWFFWFSHVYIVLQYSVSNGMSCS